MGHNGAGKSTTIDLLLGLKKADRGSGTIFGTEPGKNRKKVFEKVGVQLQSSYYQNNIRVDEICGQMAALYKNPQNYHTLLEFFGLEKFEKSQVNKLSGGEKQKGTTIFLTTHYMEEAESLCDRICLIKEGKKVIEGTVKEVIDGSPYENLEEAYLWYMGEEVAQ